MAGAKGCLDEVRKDKRGGDFFLMAMILWIKVENFNGKNHHEIDPGDLILIGQNQII